MPKKLKKKMWDELYKKNEIEIWSVSKQLCAHVLDGSFSAVELRMDVGGTVYYHIKTTDSDGSVGLDELETTCLAYLSVRDFADCTTDEDYDEDALIEEYLTEKFEEFSRSH